MFGHPGRSWDRLQAILHISYAHSGHVLSHGDDAHAEIALAEQGRIHTDQIDELARQHNSYCTESTVAQD